MSTFLQLVGFMWAAIGAFNLYLQDWTTPEAVAGNTFAVIVNMIAFIIPGLILGGMGHSMAKKKPTDDPRKEPPQSAPDARLQALAKMAASGLISDAEYQAKRQEILRQL